MSDYKTNQNTKLPREISDIKSSEKGMEANVVIAQKYSLSGGKITELAFLIADLFYKNIDMSELVDKIKIKFGFDDDRAKKMALDIAGRRLLAVDSWLGGKVSGYIADLGGRPDDYKKMVEEQVVSAKKEREEMEKSLIAEKTDNIYDIDGGKEAVDKKIISPEDGYLPKQVDVKKEKEDSIKIFNSDIVAILSLGDGDYLDFYNLLLLDILSSEEGDKFQDELVQSLLNNKEKLTNSQFLLNNNIQDGTVANWLKYFFEVKGTEMFDNIALSDFLIKSRNVKTATDYEKKLISKLLILYRNVKFFPNSMPNATGDGWEIIPTQATEDVQREIRVEREKDVSEKEKKVLELRTVLAKYPEGSLARRAVEEEIKRVKSQK